MFSGMKVVLSGDGQQVCSCVVRFGSDGEDENAAWWMFTPNRFPGRTQQSALITDNLHNTRHWRLWPIHSYKISISINNYFKFLSFRFIYILRFEKLVII